MGNNLLPKGTLLSSGEGGRQLEKEDMFARHLGQKMGILNTWTTLYCPSQQARGTESRHLDKVKAFTVQTVQTKIASYHWGMDCQALVKHRKDELLDQSLALRMWSMTAG
jgi:hypothetical protein